jgi:hypothetical protein
MEAASFVRRYPQARPRPAGPSIAYNCHGLTFAARRTKIWNAQEIQKILEDDGYVQVPQAQVLPGDVAVYYTNGDAEHSGVVLEKPGLIPKLLSKWGNAQEFVHWANDCPYDPADIRYFRMVR